MTEETALNRHDMDIILTTNTTVPSRKRGFRGV